MEVNSIRLVWVQPWNSRREPPDDSPDQDEPSPTARRGWRCFRAARRLRSGSRHFRGSAGDPTLGIIAALHQPYVTHVDHDAIRLRGLEEVQLDGKIAAVPQEWLVSLL